MAFPWPGANHRLGVQRAGEPLIVQALSAEAFAEGLEVGVLGWLARITQPPRHAAAVRPDQHGVAAVNAKSASV